MFRHDPLYPRPDDIRSEFYRDYTRILHSTAYRRLKFKAQVFSATQNDHVCTRIEHVNHVASVSYTLSNYLGLDTELTAAIAIGHDVGHAPFGHVGETILTEIAQKDIGIRFWHERNSLRFVDKLETLKGPDGREQNLMLTYAVRDGIISHCGEADEKGLKPREAYLDLGEITEPNQHEPYTWEGCVVKISDKIAYLGRDIEDALALGVLTVKDMDELRDIIRASLDEILEPTNTSFMHRFMIDLCKNSTPEKGLVLSPEHYELMKRVRAFSAWKIYTHPRLLDYKEYAKVVLGTIYRTLVRLYRGVETYREVNSLTFLQTYPHLAETFCEWMVKYARPDGWSRPAQYGNEIVYDLADDWSYRLAVIEYIAGMTDGFAIRVFQELMSF